LSLFGAGVGEEESGKRISYVNKRSERDSEWDSEQHGRNGTHSVFIERGFCVSVF